MGLSLAPRTPIHSRNPIALPPISLHEKSTYISVSACKSLFSILDQTGFYHSDKLKFLSVRKIEFSIIHEFLMVIHQGQKRMSFSFS